MFTCISGTGLVSGSKKITGSKLPGYRILLHPYCCNVPDVWMSLRLSLVTERKFIVGNYHAINHFIAMDALSMTSQVCSYGIR